MAIAFFDLDKTLLSVNSGSLWVKRETRLGHLSKRHALQAMAWLTRYHLGLANAEEMVLQAVRLLEGLPAEPIRQRTRAFYDAEIQQRLRPGALEAVKAHRDRGDVLVMLTSSSNYLATLVAAQLRFDSVLCNTLEVDAADVHTGRLVGRACFGAGKHEFAQAEAARRGVKLRDCAFYTDSYSDLSVLEAVSTPVAVNPDPRLKRHARKQGWSVVDWGS